MATTVHSAERFHAYSDAIIGIAATVMASTIATAEDEEAHSVQKVLHDKERNLIMFILTYFVVCLMWRRHAQLTGLLETVSRLQKLLNLFASCAITFLPIAFTLYAQYLTTHSPAAYFYFLMVIVACFFLLLLQLTIPIHSRLGTKYGQAYFMLQTLNHTAAIFGGIAALCTVAIALDANPKYQSLAFTMFLATEYFFRRLFYAYMARTRPAYFVDEHNNLLPYAEFYRLRLPSALTVSRVAGFSDGVFSIAATLTLLEIQAPLDDSREFWDVVGDQSNQIVSYVITFFLVGMLWNIHHELLLRIRVFNLLLAFFNMCMCCAVSFLPFFVNLMTQFSESKLAHQLPCIMLGTAALFQAITFIAAGYCHDPLTGQKLLQPHNSNNDVNVIHDRFLLYRLFAIPGVALLSVLVLFATHHIRIFFFLASPVIEVLLWLAESRAISQRHHQPLSNVERDSPTVPLREPLLSSTETDDLQQ